MTGDWCWTVRVLVCCVIAVCELIVIGSPAKTGRRPAGRPTLQYDTPQRASTSLFLELRRFYHNLLSNGDFITMDIAKLLCFYSGNFWPDGRTNHCSYLSFEIAIEKYSNLTLLKEKYSNNWN